MKIYVLYTDWLLQTRKDLKPKLFDKIFNGIEDFTFIDDDDIINFNNNQMEFFKDLFDENFKYVEIEIKSDLFLTLI